MTLAINSRDRGYLPDNTVSKRSKDYRDRLQAMTAWLTGLETKTLYSITNECLTWHAILYGVDRRQASEMYGRECECRLK